MRLIDDLCRKYGFDDTQIQMVQETAEKMAVSLVLLGVGSIEKAWLTATENFTNVSYAYNKGYFEGRKNALENAYTHGHWITHNPDSPFEIYGECSECCFEQSLSEHLNYCPSCGAKMDEVSE
ncbi:MAG: hypothetical protein KBT27_09835 [Prevotellaceae bacterium]|nr:hypothetical protein [Candidatus Faecinaster equi]